MARRTWSERTRNATQDEVDPGRRHADPRLGGVAGAVVRGRRGEGVPVWVGRVERKDLEAVVTANGTLEAETKVDVSANIMGQIVALNVREGDRVRKGDLLMVIDPAQFRAVVQARRSALSALESEVARSRESAALAEREVERAERQVREGILAAAELDRARSAWQQESSAAIRVQKELDRARAELPAPATSWPRRRSGRRWMASSRVATWSRARSS